MTSCISENGYKHACRTERRRPDQIMTLWFPSARDSVQYNRDVEVHDRHNRRGDEGASVSPSSRYSIRLGGTKSCLHREHIVSHRVVVGK